MTSIEFREPERSDLCIDLSPLSQRRRNWERNVRHNDLDLHANRMREMRDKTSQKRSRSHPGMKDQLIAMISSQSLSSFLSNHNIF